MENVHRPLTRSRLLLTVLAAALCGSGCGSDPRRVLAAHRQALASCEQTAAMIGEAWLSGTVSARYAQTAYQETVRILAQHHAELSADLPLLATADGAAMSDAEERVSRAAASLSAAIGRGDASAVRRESDALARGSSLP